MALNSCLYECVVSHRRQRPRLHAFEHRMLMLYIDLDELADVDRQCRLLSVGGANLYSFRDGDYCPTGTGGDLKARVLSFLGEHDVATAPITQIRLLTLPRVLGYIFNPISIYFCSDRQGTPLCAIAEVGNTFRERKLFLLPCAPHEPGARAGRFRLRVPKHYYVSPFSDLDLAFDFDLRVPGARLQVHIEDWDAHGKLLDSHLRGLRVPLTDRQLLRLALKYPAVTLKVIGLIHWHALRLALKGVPWHRKAERPELQREVLDPSPQLRRDLASPADSPGHAH
jgi:hypothetical protein